MTDIGRGITKDRCTYLIHAVYSHLCEARSGSPQLRVALIFIVTMILFRLDARINGHVFLSLNESRLERFSVSVGFQFAIMNILEDMVSSWESI